MRWIYDWKQKMKRKRRYNEKAYQRLMSGLAGLSISFIAYIIWLVKWYVLS